MAFSELAAPVGLLENLVYQQHLSAALIEDIVFALFKEGVPYEQIFGGLW